MFDKEFYPTPHEVIAEMLRHADIKKENYILEPSAGKGDILDYISKVNRAYETPKLYAIEKHPELRMILNEKNYKVIGDDFLEYNSDMHFDYIIMNPPFSNGDEHLLKAWEILHTGTIICLLNSETVRNQHTKRRKLLNDIIINNGEVFELGRAFDTAERKTNVDVSMVILKKVGEDRFKFDIKYDKEQKMTLDEETLNSQIATNDVISNLVTYFISAKETIVDFIKLKEKIRFYIDPLIHKEPYSEKYIDILAEVIKLNSNNEGYNHFIERLKRIAWNKILDQPSIRNYVTTSVRQDLSEFIRQKGDMDFTKRNIQNIITELMLNKQNIFFKCVIDVFENMCSYDKENKIHIEGWKTNSAYKVNKRVILPWAIDYHNYGSDSFRTNYTERLNIDDIDKAMCLVDGKPYDNIYTITEALESSFSKIKRQGYKNGTNNKCDSLYFNIKFYKKGTLHLQFKDDKVWEQFNIMAAQGKNWIGTEDHEQQEFRLMLNN